MEELKRLYQEYIQFAQDLHASVSPINAVFGMRSAEVNHPGHLEFYNAVKRWTDGFLEKPREQSEIEQALEVILFSAAEHHSSAAVWYLIAAQISAKPLLDLLPAQRKEALRATYQKRYPRGKRLPLQNDLLTRMGK